MSISDINQLAGAILGAAVAIFVAIMLQTNAPDNDY